MATAYQEKLVIDVREPSNRNVMFRPIHRILQTEVRQSNAQRSLGNKLAAIGGVLPGERLTIDFKTRTYSIIHKLTLKEHADLRNRIKELMAADPINPETIGSFGEPQEGAFDESDVATWLYHIHQLVHELKYFELVQGKLPSKEEIHKMGRVQLSVGTGMPEKMVDKCCFIPQTEVEEKGKELVGAK